VAGTESIDCVDNRFTFEFALPLGLLLALGCVCACGEETTLHKGNRWVLMAWQLEPHVALGLRYPSLLPQQDFDDFSVPV